MVIIATGGLPHTDWLEGDAKYFYQPGCVVGHGLPEGRVLIHDQTGKNVAMAAADFLSGKGVDVTLNTQDAQIGMEAMRLKSHRS